MRTYRSADPEAPLLVLAPGAGAGEAHPWMQRVGQGLARRGVAVVTFDFPYRQAGRRLPDRGPVLEGAYREAWRSVTADAGGSRPVFVGGKSMGGRIATQIVAGGLMPPPVGVVCFGYPLHPPGRPAQRRDQHLPAVPVPLLLVHGTRDPFGTPDEMTELVGWLPQATLTLVDGADHSLTRPARLDADGRAFDGVLDEAARWIAARTGRPGASPGAVSRYHRQP